MTSRRDLLLAGVVVPSSTALAPFIQPNTVRRPSLLKGPVVHPNNHNETLRYFEKRGIAAYGAIVDSQVAPGTLTASNQVTGTWRNDTGKWLIVTGLYTYAEGIDTVPLSYLVNVQVGDRQVTGGLINANTVMGLNNTSNTQARMNWPGLGVPFPPGEQISTAVDGNGQTPPNGIGFMYEVVVVDNPRWRPPKTWLEPRWHTLTPDNVTGQQTKETQLPYQCIVWDWMRASGQTTNYRADGKGRFRVDGEYVTKNAIPFAGIPANAYKPNSELLIGVKAGATVYLYVDTQTTASQPSVIFRVAKPYGAVG